MTLFEYLSVAISVVLSLSAAQLLANLRAVFDPQRRYWVHALWVVLMLFIHVIYWWGFWAYRDVESWNLASFCLVLLNPGLLFVCSNALVLSQGSDQPSWEQHFFSVRRWFFVVLGLISAIAMLRNRILLGLPIALPPLLLVGVCVVGALSTNKRVHAALALTGFAILVLGTGYAFFEPGVIGFRRSGDG